MESVDRVEKSMEILCKDCKRHKARATNDCRIIVGFRGKSPIFMQNIDKFFKDGMCKYYESSE